MDERDAAVRRIEDAAPQGWSNWSACLKGCCLSYDGGDKANRMIRRLDTKSRSTSTANG